MSSDPPQLIRKEDSLRGVWEQLDFVGLTLVPRDAFFITNPGESNMHTTEAASASPGGIGEIPMKENLEMEIKAMKLFFLDWIRFDLSF